jgi:phosphoribosylglycinamide formyltransferase-1
VSGCTIHIVDQGVDSGPIIAQRSVTIMPSDEESSLHERIKVVERELLVETVLSIAENKVDLVKI